MSHPRGSSFSSLLCNLKDVLYNLWKTFFCQIPVLGFDCSLLWLCFKHQALIKRDSLSLNASILCGELSFWECHTLRNCSKFEIKWRRLWLFPLDTGRKHACPGAVPSLWVMVSVCLVWKVRSNLGIHWKCTEAGNNDYHSRSHSWDIMLASARTPVKRVTL